MEKTKADRNKTIDISREEGAVYLKNCLRLNEPSSREQVTDQILWGDALLLLPLLPEKSVDLLIVDPPYNLTKNYHGNRYKKTDADSYREYTIAWIEKVLPLLKENASIYVCCDWRSSMVIGEVLENYFRIQNRITWQREKGRGSKTNWKNSMEDIWFATVSKEYIFHPESVMQRRRVIAPYKKDGEPKDWVEGKDGRYRDTYPSNFWDDISIPYWSMKENTAHPTQKPEKLIAKLILASSDPGALILDPFAGSGTTAVTAKKLGRHFIGIEQNDQYCIWAQKRLEMAEEDQTIQGFEDGVFWERNTKLHRMNKKEKE